MFEWTMDGAMAVSTHSVVGAAHAGDAVVDLDRLADLYRARAAGGGRRRQCDLPLLERTLRREVAGSVLAHVLPALVTQLIDAVADDLSPIEAGDALTELESEADSDLRVFESVERCKAVLDAVGLEALARLRSTVESSELTRFAGLGRPKPPGWVDADELTAMEVSTCTGLGHHEVRARLDLATARTPGAAALRGRLQRGEVSLYRACTIQGELASLPVECGPGIVEASLRLKDGAPPSPTLFRQRLTRACLAADRDAAERRRTARRRRGAHAQITGDGLGMLTVINDADKIVAAMERADAVARAARADGDPRDLDTLRADVITDTLMFGWPTDPSPTSPTAGSPAAGATRDEGSCEKWYSRLGRRPAAAITLVVPFTTALGLTDAPCEVRGHGWVTAEHARQIMLNDGSTWRRLAVDADTGAALHLETRAYQPTPAMRAHVEAVDGTCRAPGCTVPAARCDLDHDTPWPEGRTEVANLSSKHRAHHNLHTHGHWLVSREGDRVRWRTKAARRYDTHPKDWLEAVRDAAVITPPPVSDPPPF
ncbi:hypothetical protein GCM10009721_32040 [Terrabacter tumescens]|uniref:DUF222 domain-containing protein n=1 Tax=Terrabacter tumescens TaxID=60443 RepID=A0ABQ2I8D6_9MICO|nr:HNH endonuclease signature motif containing protein [Terrabacter tumescens]GGN02405.1 hypothetical protein GCM10009721_32040 [Terrabacter tumescens]